jgi:hypothetical protein
MCQADAKQCFISNLSFIPEHRNKRKPNEIKHLQRKIPLLLHYSKKIIYTPPTFSTHSPIIEKTSLYVYIKTCFFSLSCSLALISQNSRNKGIIPSPSLLSRWFQTLFFYSRLQNNIRGLRHYTTCHPPQPTCYYLTNPSKAGTLTSG